MSRLHQLRHEFVEFVPDRLEPCILYISVQYKTMAHLCCCGCGKKVVTPISPTGWQLTYDGRTVSISPSVGNWNLDCRSHYFISGNQVRWAGQWSREMIEAGFARDRQLKQDYYDTQTSTDRLPSPATEPLPTHRARTFLTKVKEWWSRALG
jgi:Family of unknown function (DUF6527)